MIGRKILFIQNIKYLMTYIKIKLLNVIIKIDQILMS